VIPTSALIICVNYRSDVETLNFLSHLSAQEGVASLSALVVDNSSSTNAFQIQNSFPPGQLNVGVLTPTRNLGYFGAANWAMTTYLAASPPPEWVIVSNADIEFETNDFFQRLFALSPTSRGSVIAPAIISSRSCRNQNPYFVKRPSALRMRAYKWIFRLYATAATYHALSLAKSSLQGFIRRQRRTERSTKQTDRLRGGKIYAAHGSFMIFHRRFFELGGSLRHGAFLFGEEIFIAEAALRLGLDVRYEPALVVRHQEHAATKNFFDPQIAAYMREASAYLADQFF